jgi:gliding motility-associated-like protein
MIYRRSGYYGFFPGFCETGVPAYTGYRLIGETNGIGATSFQDDNNGNGLVQGIEYCYMVTAFFLDGAESYASLEACASLKRDVPVITNVSNDSTDLLQGNVYLAWSRPTELDTIQIPGPYQYLVYRNTGFGGGGGNLIETLDGLNDTLLFDNGVDLNNFSTAYSYRVELVSLTQGSVGFSQSASSIFMSITPTDEELQLTWEFSVPWINDYYVVYRKLPGEANYDSIGFSLENSFRDTLLNNGDQYCYYVKSVGQYSAPGFIKPIENFSQIACGVPIDNEPPCPPVLDLYTDCERAVNRLSWTNPNNYCADDVIKYRIYFNPFTTGDLTTLDSTMSAVDTTYVHSNNGNIVGCYAVIAIDSVGNESELSNIVCVSDTTCNRYELPNVFTPNDDNYNDFFRPFPYTSVERIDMKIFNRWGNLVFETADPDINWDGRNQSNGTDCAQGTYLYVCEVYEITLQGVQQRTLRGSITLLR